MRKFSKMRSYLAISLGMLMMSIDATSASAADKVPSGSTKVGAQLVTPTDIERELTRTIPKLPEDANVLAKLRAATRRECVRRELALQWLESQGKVIGETAIDTELQRRKKELVAKKIQWPKYLEQTQHTEASLRREVKWRLSWQNYLDEQLSDANLKRYFEKHKAEFDGTQIRVAHLLLKPTDKGMDEAQTLRVEIIAGKLSFADAVKQNSQAPTAEQGGDIGFIGRHAPMPEAFSKAAFALKLQEISPPVETAFGVHLIQCLEIKPGEQPWTASREELQTAVTHYLFDWICEQQATKVPVQYLDTNAVDDGTIAIPGQFK